jgi:UDP-GlcNAc:undecaprenyl-phosphate/decaprenyl-phosphate GlcNAc-1-phosphate transferase
VRTIIGVLAGLLACTLLWPALRPVLAQPVFERENYRRHRLPVAGGLVLVLGSLAVVAVWAAVVAGWERERPAIGPFLAATAILVAGFGLLGLLDDLAGAGSRRGFAGHVRALRAGELTTGMIKLVGGGAVAVAAVAAAGADGLGTLVARAAAVALAANLANLFDRAPGRVEKVAVLGFVAAVAAVRLDVALAGPAIVVGGGVAMLVPDLRERCMLGDTGANPLGAAVGLGAVGTVSAAAAAIVAAALLALNLVSERVSFSSVIDRLAPLRWADRLGAPYRD